MRFQKKPIIINAWRVQDLTGMNQPPLPEPIAAAEVSRQYIDNGDGTVTISTLEGTLFASKEDWIIQGVHGELYPCKPDIFAETYIPVED